jgi:hypothetical protein
MRVALAVVVVVVVVVALAASVGPPGHTYRRNADFAACMGEAWPPVDEESFEVLQRCHDTHCPDRDLHSVEAMGHYVYTRVTDEAASCDEPIELRDIIEG